MSDIVKAAEIIAAAINNLAAAQGGSSKDAVQPAKAPKGSKDSAPAAQTAAESEKAKEPEADPAKYEVVKGLILRVNKEIGRDNVTSLLGEFGATKGPELKVADYDAFIEKANAALSEADLA